MNWLARAVKRGIEATPCSRDHCTSEERAVIEAVVNHFQSKQSDGWGYTSARTERMRDAEYEAVRTLIAVRETRGSEKKRQSE